MRWIIAMGATLLGLGAALGAANAKGDVASRPCTPARPGELLQVDFDDTPLSDVARLVSCAAELNILFVPAALGAKQVTVVSARPVTLEELEALWRAVLAQHDLVMERRGAYQAVRAAATR